jgi:probable rRNA maturation factor
MDPEGDSRGRSRKAFALEIVREDGDWSAFAPLDAAIRAAADALGVLPQLLGRRGRATVLLASDARVRELNRIWRGTDKPTNVLSFPAAPEPMRRGAAFLGDIVLAAETVAAEAARDAIPPRHHLQHLVIHGLLHLLGYDHVTAADADIMEALEVAALAGIGVADPYAHCNLETAI